VRARRLSIRATAVCIEGETPNSRRTFSNV